MAQELSENGDARQMHDQLDQTRLALSEKVGALQDHLKDSVQSTRDSVEEALQSVKRSVQDSLQSLKATFDIPSQTRKHPWCMLSGSVFLGAFLSHLTDRPDSSDRSSRSSPAAGATDGAGRSRGAGSGPSSKWSMAGGQASRSETPAPATSTSTSAAASSSTGPNMKQRLTSQFHDEIAKVQRMAIGVGVGIFRDWIKKAMPSIAAKLEEVIDSATSKMGGEPVDGPVLRQGRNGNGEQDR